MDASGRHMAAHVAHDGSKPHSRRCPRALWSWGPPVDTRQTPCTRIRACVLHSCRASCGRYPKPGQQVCCAGSGPPCLCGRGGHGRRSAANGAAGMVHVTEPGPANVLACSKLPSGAVPVMRCTVLFDSHALCMRSPVFTTVSLIDREIKSFLDVIFSA